MREREPVTQTLKASDARQQWSQLFNRIYRKESRGLVEKRRMAHQQSKRPTRAWRRSASGSLFCRVARPPGLCENAYMTEPTEWTTEFYRDADGESPVEAFLDSLDLKTRARFRWSMEQLRARNVQARQPLARHLEGDLWELREESATNIYRVIYFFFTGRRIVFLHGFQKKSQRTPPGEIELAERRAADFRIRQERREGQ